MRIIRPNITKKERLLTPNETTPNSFVYVFVCTIGLETYCKVGFSESPEKRLKSIQTASPEKTDVFFTINGCRKHEKKAHFILDQYRTNGEWFKCSPSIAVNAVKSAQSWRRFKQSVNAETKKLKRSKKEAALTVRKSKAADFCRGVMKDLDHNMLIDHGKHKGKTIGELLNVDPIYLRFFLCDS